MNKLDKIDTFINWFLICLCCGLFVSMAGPIIHQNGYYAGVKETERHLFGIGELYIEYKDSRIQQLETLLKRNNITIPPEPGH